MTSVKTTLEESTTEPSTPAGDSTTIDPEKGRGLSIRQKIHIGFGGLILLMLTGMGITLYKLADIELTADAAIVQRQPAAALFQRLNQDLNLATTLLNGYLLTKREDLKEEYEIIEEDLFSDFAKITELKLFKQGAIPAKDIARTERLLRQFRDYAKQLFALRNTDRKNYPGMELAIETLNPPAAEFMGLSSILLESEDFDLANPKHQVAYILLQDVRFNWLQMMSALRIYINTQLPDNLKNFHSYFELNGTQLAQLIAMNVDVGLGELEGMRAARERYFAAVPPVLEIFKTDAWRADAYLMKTEVQPITGELRTIFENIADEQLNAASSGGIALTQALDQTRISTIVIIVIGLSLGLLLAIRITSGIVPHILQLMTAAKQISEGDLNTKVAVTSQDEIGQLGETFNIMVSDLQSAARKELQHADELNKANLELENRVQARTAELEHSESKTRAVLDNIGEGILVLNERGSIESMNPAAEVIFDMKEVKAIGLHGAQLVTHNDADDIAELDDYDDETDGVFKTSANRQPIEYQGVRANGDTFPLEIVVSSMSVGDKRLRVCILRDVTVRKETETQLADAAHKSGMAEMATGVLHNIGNILNSVNLSGETVLKISTSSKISGLLKATEMMQEQKNISDFLANDSRGQKLPAYIIKMGKVLNDEITEITKESRELIQKTTMMKEVISTQQSYAKSGFQSKQLDCENLHLAELVEDALKIQEASLNKYGVVLEKNYADIPKCNGHKSKLLQVITNLVKNAKEAMEGNDRENKPKEMIIETGMLNDEAIYLTIKDNGCGISEEQLKKMFTHGFTTKETGHGFGLHSCVKAMTEMKGSLKVDSEGVEKGATFTVTIPVSQAA